MYKKYIYIYMYMYVCMYVYMCIYAIDHHIDDTQIEKYR